MKRFAVLIVVALVLGVQGCSTGGAGGRSSLEVSLLSDGKVSVEGRVTAMPGLPKAVKAAGAGPSTSIRVAVPQGGSQAEMMRITKTLRQAGYVRVLFTRPRRAQVSR